MSAGSRAAVWSEAGGEPRAAAGAWTRSLSLGLLSMAPLFLAYEAAVLAAADGLRNTSQLVLFRAFELLGDDAELARRWALALALLASLVHCLRAGVPILPRTARVLGEGALAAVLLGPLVVVALGVLGEALPPLELGAGPPGRPPELARAGRALGGAAYEELLFRVVALPIVWLATARVLAFLGVGAAPRRWAAELAALAVSALLFAAVHLRAAVAWLGVGGEPFDTALFAYRALAGLLLGLLFRWRGIGVAAWAHGLFNLALLLGAGPEVFL